MNYESPARSGPDDGPVANHPRILEAARYLDQSRRNGCSFAVLIGAEKGETQLAIDRFIAELPAGCRIARMPAPTDSSHAFLEAILAQLGFEPFDSTADDLQRLLTVVLRAGGEASTIIIAEDAQDFGPRVFETIRELARNARDGSAGSTPLLVLAGHAGLNRVLDSRGMAGVLPLTRMRFDMASAPQTASSPAAVIMRPQSVTDAESPRPALELSLGDDLLGRFPLDRDRVLIGRSQHCDICIASRFVSRQHALLVRNPDGDWLIDLKSTNGTSVNSQVVEHRRLNHGDVISIGNHRLRYDSPVVTPRVAPARPTRDQLSETMVMRSLQAMREAPEREASSGTPTAA